MHGSHSSIESHALPTQHARRPGRVGMSSAAGDTRCAFDLSAALETVLDPFAGRLCAIGARFQLHPAELEELRQEVRLRLWRAIGDGDRIRALAATYLYRTASSSAMDLIRRRRSAGKIPLDAPESLQLLDSGPSAHDELERAELTAHVDVIIGTIPASRREVVRLYLAGHRVCEIAARFGWTETRVRNLVFRGVAEVRARLRDAGVDGG